MEDLREAGATLLNAALLGRIYAIEAAHYEQGRSGTSQRTKKADARLQAGWLFHSLRRLIVTPAYSQTSAPWRDPSSHAVRFVAVETGVRLEVLDWAALETR